MTKLIQLKYLCVLICLSLAGCGSGGSESTSQAPEQVVDNSSGSSSNNDSDDSSGQDSTDDSSDDSSEDSSEDSGSDSDSDQNDDADNDADNDSDDQDADDNTGDDTSEESDLTFATATSTSRFIQHATFGATPTDITNLTGQSASKWFKDQLQLPPSLKLPVVNEYAPTEINEDDEFDVLHVGSTTIAFWRHAISADDQLRQRMAFALSEILVVSNAGGEELTDIPEAVSSYQDILINHAFGNYRTLLEAVTYSPSMGFYLTYMGNMKGDETTGRVPDENYARELLQLFTLGVVALNQDGTEQIDDDGKQIELYSNEDITGLARVFTGLDLDLDTAEATQSHEFAIPMAIYPKLHSEKEKSFLGTQIAAGTGAQASITQALDHIFNHPNMPPFVSKQLIQRLVSSNPSSEYVTRVATAFSQGQFTLPDGSNVGDKQRGDLTATLAAILFDPEATGEPSTSSGKIREPILRFTQWARAFEIENVTPEFQEMLWDTSPASMLSQHPYRSKSVFNFFRPGYAAPGTETAANGLVAPELQITNATSIPGYTNFMTFYIAGLQGDVDVEELQADFDDNNIRLDARNAVNSFFTDYDKELALANDVDALLAHLNLLLSAEQLSAKTLGDIKPIISRIEEDDEEGYLLRVKLAILLVMTSPDYLVQK